MAQEQQEINPQKTPIRSKFNRLVVISGVSGCGKDYLIKRSLTPDLNSNIKLFPFGELLYQQLRLCSSNFCSSVLDRDQVKDSFTQDQISVQIAQVAQNIVQEQPGLINTHLVYRQRDSLIANPTVIESLNPRNIIFISANPNNIYEWRKMSSRKRDVESVDYISFFQNVERDISTRFAEYLGSGFLEIKNSPAPDSISNNVTLLKLIISKI